MDIPRLKEKFDKDGFVVLPKFFSDQKVDAALAAVHACKLSPTEDTTIDFTDKPSPRTLLTAINLNERKSRRFKINDLYLNTEAIRQLGMHKEILPILESLMQQKPVLCNSLNMDFGSTQQPHVDALYMTPRSTGHLIAIWVALEDAHEDAGQLEYFPGSHLIPQYVFSSGGMHFVADEMHEWEKYIMQSVTSAGLERKKFAAKRGDVLIWHAYLLHGGTPINDVTRTRKSVVFHYYSETDCRAMECQLEPLNSAFWMNRLPAELPHDVLRTMPFSERGYLARYPDVAAAVQSGSFQSGAHHFEAFGKQEGRLPR